MVQRSCSTCIIPWLAQSYTVSTNQRQYTFTLRTGITFADGEQFNSSAVYFSLNRLLVMDGSTPEAHGTQASGSSSSSSTQPSAPPLSGGQTGSSYVRQSSHRTSSR